MRVLAPVEARPGFERRALPGLEVSYYETRRTGLPQRLLRRLLRRTGGAVSPPMIQLLDPSSAAKAEAVWVSSRVPPTRAEILSLLKVAPATKFVYWQRTSLDELDTSVLLEHGIRIQTTASLTTGPTAETMLACIVADAKLLGLARGTLGKGAPPFTSEFRELRVCMVGTGRIARKLASLCRPLGIKTLALSRRPDDVMAHHGVFDEVASLPRDLPRGASESTHLVLALPLTADTRGLISARILGGMNNTTLINLARPGIVDQHAMIHCLADGSLRRAWVSRLEDLSWVDRYRARRLDNLYFTHNLEANVRSKSDRSFEQFLEFLASVEDRSA